MGFVEETVIAANMAYIVVVNTLIVSAVLILGGRFLVRRSALTAGVPDARQNVGEFVLDFFVKKARDMGDRDVVLKVAPFLATCFLFIFVSNLMGMIPLPLLNNPPTSFFAVPLGLALCAVGGTLIISGVMNGLLGAVKHLFWPNPLQWISEVTDVLSLSLRLFGNIGGEHMTLVLVTSSVAVGIPLILHVLGLIPAFVQALVFTLLTASFIAGVIHKHEEHTEERAVATPASQGDDAPIAIEGDAPVPAPAG